mmetsp:Transcript_96658/g.273747  ORF Transcript_96658/g.273747 Transcript_96658/m.273747 type:complete len:290 (+) Transcript_96658:1234-2103(+)
MSCPCREEQKRLIRNWNGKLIGSLSAASPIVKSWSTLYETTWWPERCSPLELDLDSAEEPRVSFRSLRALMTRVLTSEPLSLYSSRSRLAALEEMCWYRNLEISRHFGLGGMHSKGTEKATLMPWYMAWRKAPNCSSLSHPESPVSKSPKMKANLCFVVMSHERMTPAAKTEAMGTSTSLGSRVCPVYTKSTAIRSVWYRDSCRMFCRSLASTISGGACPFFVPAACHLLKAFTQKRSVRFISGLMSLQGSPLSAASQRGRLNLPELRPDLTASSSCCKLQSTKEKDCL